MIPAWSIVEVRKGLSCGCVKSNDSYVKERERAFVTAEKPASGKYNIYTERGSLRQCCDNCLVVVQYGHNYAVGDLLEYTKHCRVCGGKLDIGTILTIDKITDEYIKTTYNDGTGWWQACPLCTRPCYHSAPKIADENRSPYTLVRAVGIQCCGITVKAGLLGVVDQRGTIVEWENGQNFDHCGMCVEIVRDGPIPVGTKVKFKNKCNLCGCQRDGSGEIIEHIDDNGRRRYRVKFIEPKREKGYTVWRGCPLCVEPVNSFGPMLDSDDVVLEDCRAVDVAFDVDIEPEVRLENIFGTQTFVLDD